MLLGERECLRHASLAWYHWTKPDFQQKVNPVSWETLLFTISMDQAQRSHRPGKSYKGLNLCSYVLPYLLGPRSRDLHLVPCQPTTLLGESPRVAHCQPRHRRGPINWGIRSHSGPDAEVYMLLWGQGRPFPGCFRDINSMEPQ